MTLSQISHVMFQAGYVKGSASISAGSIHTMFERIDDCQSFIYTANVLDSWFHVDVATNRTSRTVSNVTHYTICTYSCQQPYSWHLLASADDVKWHRLDERSGETIWSKFRKTFTISAPTLKAHDHAEFRYFKLQVVLVCVFNFSVIVLLSLP